MDQTNQAPKSLGAVSSSKLGGLEEIKAGFVKAALPTVPLNWLEPLTL